MGVGNKGFSINRNHLVQISGLFVASLYSYVFMSTAVSSKPGQILHEYSNYEIYFLVTLYQKYLLIEYMCKCLFISFRGNLIKISFFYS